MEKNELEKYFSENNKLANLILSILNIIKLYKLVNARSKISISILFYISEFVRVMEFSGAQDVQGIQDAEILRYQYFIIEYIFLTNVEFRTFELDLLFF